MNKTLLKIIIIITVILIFLYGFSSSYYANSITNISYVTAIAIDLSDDGDNLKVTFEFMDTSQFSQNGSSEQSEPVLNTITAKSISSAINILDTYIGKQANLAHCKIIVFSTDVAKDGISAEITELMNNIQVRPSTNIVVSKCQALEYIKNSSSSLDKVLTQYYDIFPSSSEYTGYTSNVTLGDFYNNLISENSGNIAILGGLASASQSSNTENESSGEQSSSGQSGGEHSSDEQSSETEKQQNSSTEQEENSNVDISTITAGNAPIEGDKLSESIGIAVFKDDKYIGELTALESLCHSILTDEVETFTLSIDNTEFYNYYVDLYLFHNTDNKIDVSISENTPEINIQIQLKGKILGTKNDNTISKNIDLEELSNASSKYLETILTDYLNKTSLEFECDINNFYLIAKKNFLTNQQWNDFDWSSQYKNAKFTVSVDSTISYNLFGTDE